MKSSYENSKDFLASIFLNCPQCGGRAYIEKLGENNYGKFDRLIAKCPCSRWKIKFEIEETN